MTTDIRDRDLPSRLAALLVDQAAASRSWAGARPIRHRMLPAPFGQGQSIPLSYSQINLYESCHRQYFYARTLGLCETEESIHMTFGSTVHAVLDALNRAWQTTGAVPAPEQIEAAIDAHWPERGFQFTAQTRQLRTRASGILQRYFRWERQRVPERRPVLVESNFRAGYGQHVFSGRIDVVLEDAQGSTEIVDFKTSRWTSDSVKNPAQSLQLFIYDHAHRTQHPEAQPAVAFYALRHEKDRGFTNVEDWDDRQIKGHQHSDESRQALKIRMDALIASLEANDFTPHPAHNVCNRCAYRWLCPEGLTV